MSYSDRESSGYGAMGGVGGVLIVVLLIGLRVGLKAMARASRNNNYSSSQNDGYAPSYAPNSGLNLPETRRSEPQHYDPPPTPTPQVELPQKTPQQAQREAEEAALRQQRENEAAQEAQRLAAEQALPNQQAANQPGGILPDANQPGDNQPANQLDANQRAQLEAERLAKQQDLQNQQAAAARNNAAAAPFAPQAQAGLDQPPGFAVTDVGQIKPRDSVFALSEGKWYPALVLTKRGQLIQIRYTTNKAMEAVALDRIRLEKEPGEVAARPAAGLPAALRAVGQGPKAKTAEPDDDSLFIARPKKDDDPSSEVSPVPAVGETRTPAATKVAPTTFRTWANDTGEFKVEAELVGFEFNLVQLKRRDGKVLSLPIDKLSAADQQVVREKYK